ncbi:MFS transporter [Legionella antarctica]|uniref:Lysosomal dipeptide transporter MFSD1 n=1 Tax=Legionella antarctica TaxID=2708020 RepID=A0A6F8T200_9GAMM|nr:MFS transporter [Legionella antarctica]BCA94491.1 MFS transporter [Legionella antarctica]
MSHSVAVDSRVFVPRGDLMAWIVCLSAGLFFMYEFFQLNIFDVINQPLRDEFHIDAAQLSWMSSTYLWADILFLLPAGILLDRFSTRRVILIAMLVCVLGTLGFAITESFALASLFHFLSGIGNAFCFLSCVVLVSHWFPPRRQALVIGSLVTMAFIGGMMAHTPFAYLYDLFGWRRALLIDAAVGAVLLLWIYITVQDKPALSPGRIHTNQGQIIAGFKKALANPQNWLAGFYTSFLNLPIMVLCALWGASYLQVAHHLSDIAASNVVSLIFMGSVIGCPLVGWLSDTHGRRKPLMIIGALATLITVVPLFLHIALSQMVLGIIFFALGFFTSTQVISYPLVAESNEAQNTGAATGIASVLIMGGGGVGQVLFGWLMTHHAGTTSAHYAIADFQFAMWMFPIAAIAALFAVLMTRETYCKR